MATIPKIPQDVSLIIDRLLMSLETYYSLPTHLGILYLMLAPKNSILYKNLSTSLMEDSDEEQILFIRRELNLNFTSPNNDIRPWEKYCIREFDLTGKDLGTFNISDTFELSDKVFFEHPNNIKPSYKIREYVYSRHNKLIEPIRILVDYFSKTSGGIPGFLIYPYLNLFRNESISTRSLTHTLKWDNQTHSLKYKRNSLDKKSHILTAIELTDFYDTRNYNTFINVSWHLTVTP